MQNWQVIHLAKKLQIIFLTFSIKKMKAFISSCFIYFFGTSTRKVSEYLSLNSTIKNLRGFSSECTGQAVILDFKTFMIFIKFSLWHWHLTATFIRLLKRGDGAKCAYGYWWALEENKLNGSYLILYYYKKVTVETSY